MIQKAQDQPTRWISSILRTPKKDKGTTICIDMREANMAIQQERYNIMPTIDDFKAANEMFAVRSVSSKRDLQQAYHQLPLAVESRYITTFTNQEGLFGFKRPNYGTNRFFKMLYNEIFIIFAS